MICGVVMFKIIDQREIQKLGGRLSRYPYSYTLYCFVKKHFNIKDIVIWDCTFGHGRFYACWLEKPKMLIASDPYVHNWIVKPDIFIPETVWSAKRKIKKLNIKIDLLIVDPPFGGSEYHSREAYTYLIGSPNLIVEEAFKASNELGIKHIILHYNKIVEKENFKIIDGFTFKAVCRFLNATPQSHTILYEKI